MNTIKVSGKDISLDVSAYTMGTGFFGARSSEEEAYKILDYYYEHDGRSIDTARYYGVFDTGKPQSEPIVGKWLNKTGVRKEIVLSTKGGHPGVDTTRIANPDGYVKKFSRFTREELTYDIEHSLEALGTDCIDIYWLHRDEPDVPAEEVITILNEFVDKGYTKLLGASNWTIDRIEAANKYALAHNMMPFAATQLQWSLALNTDKTCFDDTSTYINAGDHDYEWYKEQKMPIFAFSSQAGGLFSRALSTSDDPKKNLAGLRNIRASLLDEPENVKRIERVGQLCKETGLSPAEVCTSYLLSIKDVPVTVLIGCRTMEQLHDSFDKHIGYTFDEATVKWLETGIR